ncbi:MAG: isoleucine--tRNA ligase, partial [Pseudomonadota bacterium]
HIHIGTALTKILKDLIVRTKQMAGFDSNYVPGWDCHGLPIEWKVEENFRSKGRAKKDVPSSEFRKACRAYAQEWLDIQRAEFQRLGGEGDWWDPYTTMAYAAEASIAAELLKFADLGLLYRGSKPVMWSPVEQTALAEAEIEYHDRQSTTIWVKFPVREGGPDGASVVIWTTTPWTIPGNRAVCFGPSLSYGLYEVVSMQSDLEFEPWSAPGDKLIVADSLAESIREAGLIEGWTRVSDVDPAGFVCAHPLRGFGGGYEFDVPLLPGDHVTDDAGTGFVHTAPSHGQEDYFAWMSPDGAAWREALRSRDGKDIPYTVNEFGAYTDEAPGFSGKQIMVIDGKKKGKDGDANKSVIEQLIAHKALLARGRLTHSYPHSWRSKAPVIFRNTPQWFIALDKPTANGKTLRENALAAIDATGFTPAHGKNRLRTMVENRPDWLISRQRAWGVPITVFVNRSTGEVLRDPDVDQRILTAISERGADAWFDTEPAYFLGPDYDVEDYEKIDDILDVWFDSGSTHAFVLEAREDLTWPADVYCEGTDQHRGWFQSSLLEACGTRGRAPYDHLVTNGFVVDGDGRKMSKSLGNVVAPDQVIKQYGAEIIRIWVASSDYTEDLRISDEIIDSAVDAYRKLRNTLRYLLGALDGYTEDEAVTADYMPPLERYMLHRLAVLDGEIRSAYDVFDFKTAWRKALEFCAGDLSAFYLDIRKDALYCDGPRDKRRRAVRTVMDACLTRVLSWLAPICVFTCEEAWLARGGDESGSIHLTTFVETPETWRDEALNAQWAKLRAVRRVVTGALEVDRREKRIGASLEAEPTVFIDDEALAAALDGVDLAELFITAPAKVVMGEAPEGAFTLDDVPGVGVQTIRSQNKKCARCWRYTGDVGIRVAGLCQRCADVLGERA